MKDRLLRRAIPSMPVVARWPGVNRGLDLADRVLRHYDPRYSSLPPASLRLRIGVSNRILRNAIVFEEGQALVARFVERGWVGDGSAILELGSGAGRNAFAFRDQVDYQSYDGIDVDAEMVAWCDDHLVDDRTRFHHADLFSSVYNPHGTPASQYTFPICDASVTFSLGISVFSHLLWDDTVRYAAELGRTTATGGIAAHSFFLLDHIGHLLGDRWTFEHEIGRCLVENPKYPEAAVAYHQEDVAEVFADHGLHVLTVLDQDRHQQTVVFEKR